MEQISAAAAGASAAGVFSGFIGDAKSCGIGVSGAAAGGSAVEWYGAIVADRLCGLRCRRRAWVESRNGVGDAHDG